MEQDKRIRKLLDKKITTFRHDETDLLAACGLTKPERIIAQMIVEQVLWNINNAMRDGGMYASKLIEHVCNEFLGRSPTVGEVLCIQFITAAGAAQALSRLESQIVPPLVAGQGMSKKKKDSDDYDMMVG